MPSCFSGFEGFAQGCSGLSWLHKPEPKSTMVADLLFGCPRATKGLWVDVCGLAFEGCQPNAQCSCTGAGC